MAIAVSNPRQPAVIEIGTRRLVTLLATGATQHTIADQLNLSIRSIQKQLAQLRTALGATTAYTCGTLTIRRRLLPAATVIAHARQHVNRFTEPTMREYELLRLQAAGLTDTQIALEINMSETTVRRNIRRLAHTNGARTRTSAGALFEALRWN
jgi:DNA-binding NarL/FixJ family response regulator